MDNANNDSYVLASEGCSLSGLQSIRFRDSRFLSRTASRWTVRTDTVRIILFRMLQYARGLLILHLAEATLRSYLRKYHRALSLQYNRISRLDTSSPGQYLNRDYQYFTLKGMFDGLLGSDLKQIVAETNFQTWSIDILGPIVVASIQAVGKTLPKAADDAKELNADLKLVQAWQTAFCQWIEMENRPWQEIASNFDDMVVRYEAIKQAVRALLVDDALLNQVLRTTQFEPDPHADDDQESMLEAKLNFQMAKAATPKYGLPVNSLATLEMIAQIPSISVDTYCISQASMASVIPDRLELSHEEILRTGRNTKQNEDALFSVAVTRSHRALELFPVWQQGIHQFYVALSKIPSRSAEAQAWLRRAAFLSPANTDLGSFYLQHLKEGSPPLGDSFGWSQESHPQYYEYISTKSAPKKQQEAPSFPSLGSIQVATERNNAISKFYEFMLLKGFNKTISTKHSPSKAAEVDEDFTFLRRPLIPPHALPLTVKEAVSANPSVVGITNAFDLPRSLTGHVISQPWLVLDDGNGVSSVAFVLSDVSNQRAIEVHCTPADLVSSATVLSQLAPYTKVTLWRPDFGLGGPQSRLLYSYFEPSHIYAEQLIPSPCHVCGKEKSFLKCGLCLVARYCSKECQRFDWQQLGHKKLCSHLKPARGEAALD